MRATVPSSPEPLFPAIQSHFADLLHKFLYTVDTHPLVLITDKGGHTFPNEKSATDKRMSDFSGAEVYFVELKRNSVIKGYFFLKIDSDAEEYGNTLKDFCFSKVVKCVEKSEIDGYYVMLLQIAGNSGTEYKSFYSIYKSSIKIDAVRKIIGKILEEVTNKRNIIDGNLMPSDLFKFQLKINWM